MVVSLSRNPPLSYGPYQETEKPAAKQDPGVPAHESSWYPCHFTPHKRHHGKLFNEVIQARDHQCSPKHTGPQNHASFLEFQGHYCTDQPHPTDHTHTNPVNGNKVEKVHHYQTDHAYCSAQLEAGEEESHILDQHGQEPQ